MRERETKAPSTSGCFPLRAQPLMPGWRSLGSAVQLSHEGLKPAYADYADVPLAADKGPAVGWHLHLMEAFV